ncbi:MAG: hypothetical protein Q8L96_11565 [Hylemonella sp.]|nr:hypothetical protein [Hylemonella sp.]
MINLSSYQRRFFAVATLLAASVASAQSIDFVDWKQGDRWKYKSVDMFTKLEQGTVEKVVLEIADGIYRTRFSEAAGQYDDLVRRDGTHVRAMPVGAGTFEYNELKFPVAEGKKWKSTFFFAARTNGSLGKREMDCEVADKEKVSTPSGEFDTLRIECRGYWHANGFTGRVETTRWFSPAVKWVVKFRVKAWESGRLAVADEFSLIEHQATP